MSRLAAASLSRPAAWLAEVVLLISATLFIALCAHVSVPLPFTPVPLSLQNFAVLLVGLVLGGKRGFAALALYLAEGLAGMPVFNPMGAGGLTQLLGPTGGYLLAYPGVALLTGHIFSRGNKGFLRALLAATAGELLLFASGVAWLAVGTHGSWLQALHFGLYPFVFAEIAKIMAAAGIALRCQYVRNLVNSRP